MKMLLVRIWSKGAGKKRYSRKWPVHSITCTQRELQGERHEQFQKLRASDVPEGGCGRGGLPGDRAQQRVGR